MKLTPALLRVLDLAAQGYTIEESAKILGRSEHTIHRQRSVAMDCLGAANMSHAIALAFHRKIIVWQETVIDPTSKLQ